MGVWPKVWNLYQHSSCLCSHESWCQWSWWMCIILMMLHVYDEIDPLFVPASILGAFRRIHMPACLLHQSTFSKCEETTRHLLHKLTFRRTKSELQKHAVCALGFMVISISAFGKCGAEWAMRWTAAKCSGEWWSLWFSRSTKSSINIFSMSTEN